MDTIGRLSGICWQKGGRIISNGVFKYYFTPEGGRKSLKVVDHYTNSHKKCGDRGAEIWQKKVRSNNIWMAPYIPVRNIDYLPNCQLTLNFCLQDHNRDFAEKDHT